jgi:hypothetical protein
MAFTDFGIDNLIELIKTHKGDPKTGSSRILVGDFG